MNQRIDVRRLVWDGWNEAHIAKHGVTREEVEQVCHASPIFTDSYRNRIVAIGPTHAGRILAVALDPEAEGEGVYYPVSARPASRKERGYFQEVERERRHG